MPKKRLVIDPDLLAATVEYVEAQFNTMVKYGGSRPVLSAKESDDLVYRIAEYPQRLRNMTAKAAKAAKKAKKAA